MAGLEWYNLVYAIPFVAGLVFVVISLIGLASGDGGEAQETETEGATGGHDTEALSDGDTGHDYGEDVTGSIGHDTEGAHDQIGHEGASAEPEDVYHGLTDQSGGGAQSEKISPFPGGKVVGHGGRHVVEHHGSGFGTATVLNVLGVGRAPVTMLMQNFLILFGALGWLTNSILAGLRLSPGNFLWLSAPVAGVGALLITRATADLFARIFGYTGPLAQTKRQLVGFIGRVLYDVTEESGWVLVRDRFGNRRQLACRTRKGHRLIPRGKEVILIDYDEATGQYVVIESKV